MKTKKFLVPREGVKVRDEATGEHIPAAGARRHITAYYDRRIKDGDLMVRDEAPTIVKPASKPGNKKQDGDK